MSDADLKHKACPVCGSFACPNVETYNKMVDERIEALLAPVQAGGENE